MKKTTPFGTILGERTLVPADGGRGTLVVSLGTPRPTPGHDDWGCPFRLKGLGVNHVDCAYGIDALQALTNALAAIRYFLDRLERPVTLAGCLPPETGFSRFIPIGLGSFSRKLERMVEREQAAFYRRLKRRHELREKRQQTKRARPTSSRRDDRRNRPGRGR